MSESTNIKYTENKKLSDDEIAKYDAVFKDISIRRAEAGFCSTSNISKFLNDILISDPFLTGFSIKIDWNSSALFKDLNYFYNIKDYTDTQRIVSSKLTSLCKNYQNDFDNFYKAKTISYNLVGPILGKRNRELYMEPYGAIEYLYLNDMYKVDGTKKKADDVNSALGNSKESDYQRKINELEAERKSTKALIDEYNDTLAEYQIKQGMISCRNVADAVNSLSAGDLRRAVSSATSSDYTMYKGMIDGIKESIAKAKERLTAIDSEILIYQELLSTELANIANTKASLSTGDNDKADAVLAAPNSVMNLIRFYQAMKQINDDRQFVISRIEGISELIKYTYDLDNSDSKEFTMMLREDVGLSITRMMSAYREAVYDTKYFREKVPVHLQKFNMSVFVYDCRSYMNRRSIIGRSLIDLCDNLSEYTNRKGIISENSAATFNDYVLKLLSEHISVIELFFTGCRIKDMAYGPFDSMNVTSKGEGAENSIKFTFDTIDMNPVAFKDVNSIFNFVKI